jgi:hypothetical protein
VLKVLEEWFKKRVSEINNGKGPKVEKLDRINFVKQGKETSAKSTKRLKTDERWNGSWKIAVDLETLLVFPLVATAQRPDIVIWSDDKKKAVIMELTISWEDNIKSAEERKDERYKDLIERCEEDGWEVDYHHIGIGARGYIENGFIHLLKRRFGFSQSETNKLVTDVQKTAEKHPFGCG